MSKQAPNDFESIFKPEIFRIARCPACNRVHEAPPNRNWVVCTCLLEAPPGANIPVRKILELPVQVFSL